MGCMDNLINKVPQVDSCCCGCELSTGAKFVAWMQVVTGILIELAGAAIIALLYTSRSQIKPGPDHDAQVAVIIVGMVVTGAVMLFCLFGLVMGFVLLIGVNKSDNKKVKFWLNVEIILFILQVVSLMGGFISMLANKEPGRAFSQLFSSAITCAISFYWLVVVKSYYAKQEAAFQRVPINNP